MLGQTRSMTSMPEGVVYPEQDRATITGVITHAIESYQRLGYAVTRQTPTTAVLIKPRRFSFLGFLLVGWWYAMFHATGRDETVYLSVDAGGHLTIRKA